MTLETVLGGRAAVRISPANRGRIRRLAAAGRLVRVLPGTYVRAGTQRRREVLAEALCLCDPQAVLTGAAAAALHLRRGRWPEVITFRSPRRWRLKAPWFRATRGATTPELVVEHPVRHVAPAAAVLQLTGDSSREVDRALRKKKVTPQQLLDAAQGMSRQWGNAVRRRIARESQDNPWSAPERTLHREFRAAGITGWRGNALVMIRGQAYYLDAAFAATKVAVEVDSWEYHSGYSAFQKDRRRHNELESAGWTVLHVTPEMLDNSPQDVVRWVRQTLRRRAACSIVPS
ncbi:hypothetical protein GCM10027418_09500 [Mariniluteicoccus endophyticus]